VLRPVKVISSLGKIKFHTIVCSDTECGPTGTAPGAGSLTESLFLDGPTGVNTKTSTVIMFVTNTSNEIVTDVQPSRGFAGLDDCDTNNFWTETIPQPGGILETITNCRVSPNVPVVLGPHEVTIFKWDFTVGGDIDAEFQFCNYAIGTDPIPNPVDSQPQSCDEITIINPNDCGGAVCGPGGGGGEPVLSDELFGRPLIFMIFPNPIGEDISKTPPHRGIWSVNVANPTDLDIYVSKVLILGTSPVTGASDVIFEGNCEDLAIIEPEKPITIAPTTDKWYCPATNQLVWQDLANPQIVKPRSVFPFLVKIGGKSLGSGLNDSTNLVIQPIIFTTLGQYGKAGYGSSFTQKDTAIPNVYLSRTPGSTSDIDIISELRGIVSGATVTFNVTLADMTTTSTQQINDDTTVIINVPSAWTLVSVDPNPAFDTPVIQVFPNDSSQISAKLTSGNPITGDNDAETIVFTAIAPTVFETKLYVMYILADGTATSQDISDVAAGPLAETILQVCPTTGCPP